MVKQRELSASTVAHAVTSDVDLVTLLRRLVVEAEVRLGSLVGRLVGPLILVGLANRCVVVHLPVRTKILGAVLVLHHLGGVVQCATIAVSGTLVIIVAGDVVLVQSLALVRQTTLRRSLGLASSRCSVVFELKLVSGARACLVYALNADG